MNTALRRTAIALAVEMALPLFALADMPSTLPEVVVTGASMNSPLVVETDLKVPRQPLPAHDGADYLKTIPGFSVIRKGGTDGDPVLRGMAGSRLNILVDGQNMLGGCNMRMDAPTAYIFPEAYDKLTVIKGPQSVIYGAGNSAGTVLFEREQQGFEQPGYRFHASLLGASFGRHDEVVDAQFGNEKYYAQVTGTHSQSGDYKDGEGVKVHSRYNRYSGSAAFGLTPDRDTRIELSVGMSDGYAAYADRSMDGTQFRRENISLKFDKKNISSLIEKIEAQVYQNKVDHIMDDQELRTPGMMGYADLQRDTEGARIAAPFRLADPTKLVVGLDAQNNSHQSRSAPAATHIYTPFQDDAEFKQQGLFAEITHLLSQQQRLMAGYRADFWKATDLRTSVKQGMGSVANPSQNQTRKETLQSGFTRYERDLGNLPVTLYAGLGHSERFPDYWEMIAKESVTSVSAFDIKPEKTNQLDVGVIYKSGPAKVSVSTFYNKLNDFILVDYTLGGAVKKSTGAARNIDATSYGAEVGFDYVLNSNWKLNTSLAYVRGSNDTDNTALAQLPPLEGRIGLSYDNQVWSVGSLLRLVAAQDRYDLNRGNIVGKDLGASSGFGIFSINAGYRPSKTTLLSVGVDNLFDQKYAEFISRSGSSITGYTQTLRINEPGRTAWLKASISFD